MPGSQYFPTPATTVAPTPAPVMNLNPSNAFIATNQAEMLGSNASDNDTCFRSDLNQVFTLIDQPANILANWKVHPVPTPTAPVPAPTAGATAPVNPVANQIWTNTSAAPVAFVPAGATAVWTSNAWLVLNPNATIPAAIPAPTAGATAPVNPVANQIWTNTSAATVASVPAGATAVWNGNAWLVLEKPTVASPTTIPFTSAQTNRILGGSQTLVGPGDVIVRNDIVSACSFGTWSAGTLTFSQSGTYEIDISAIITVVPNSNGTASFTIAALVAGVSKAETTTQAAVLSGVGAMGQSLSKSAVVNVTAGQTLVMKACLKGTPPLASGGLGVHALDGFQTHAPNGVVAEMIVKKLA
jgi:hypothetical protein